MDENLPSSPASIRPSSVDWIKRLSCLSLAGIGLSLIWVLGGRLYGELQYLAREMATARNREPVGYVGIHNEHPDLKPDRCIKYEGDRVLLWAGSGMPEQAKWFDVTGTDLPLTQFAYAFGRDRIKAIDYPILQDPDDEIARRIYPERPVIGVVMGSEARAYPLTVLEKVEVVNETIGGRHIAVTYCPLLQTAAVFERSLQGEPVSLGTSGYCYQEAFVLYDRATDSLWHPRPEGLRAITGPLAGEVLPVMDRPQPIAWGEWRRQHPGTQVLIGADRSRGIPLPSNSP